VATEAKAPADWSREVRAGFEALVRSGGEVPGAGLSARIAEAQSLACHFEDRQLVAVAALKNPRLTYREKLCDRSGFDLSKEKYAYEVGWVYVAENHRGSRLSRLVVEACLTEAGSGGVFATTREDNEAMQRTLKRYGFVRAGKAYESERVDVLLVLLVREGGRATSGVGHTCGHT